MQLSKSHHQHQLEFKVTHLPITMLNNKSGLTKIMLISSSGIVVEERIRHLIASLQM